MYFRVVGAASVQLVIFSRVYSNPNTTNTIWVPILLNQVTRCLSLITACIPYLKPFMESLESGVVRVEDVPDAEEYWSTNRSEASRYVLSDLSNSAPSCRPTSGQLS